MTGSFIFWMRTNTEGPYLVMTPLPDTALARSQLAAVPHASESSFRRGQTEAGLSLASAKSVPARRSRARPKMARLNLMQDNGFPNDYAAPSRGQTKPSLPRPTR